MNTRGDEAMDGFLLAGGGIKACQTFPELVERGREPRLAREGDWGGDSLTGRSFLGVPVDPPHTPAFLSSTPVGLVR